MTSSPAPDLEELERLLAEPAKWQGVDRRGAWIASAKNGDHVYVRDVISALIAELRAAREAAARADALAEIRAGVERAIHRATGGECYFGGGEKCVHQIQGREVLALLDPPKSVPDVGSPCPLCGRPLDPGEWDAGPECENSDCTWGRSVST